MERRRILAIAVAGALLVCTGCADEKGTEDVAVVAEAPLGIAVEVTEAVLGEMRAEYALTGKVGAVSELQVFPMLAGQVQTLSVEEGDTVSKGQTLFTVDTSTVTSTLSSLESSYSSTRAATDQAIRNAEIGVRNAQSNVEQAQRAVNQALLGVESAKRTVESANNGKSQAMRSLEQVKRAKEQAESGVEQAQRAMEQAKSGVEQAQLAKEQAERGVEQAQRGVEGAQSAVTNAQISVDQAQEASDNMHALFEVGAVSQQDVTKTDDALKQAMMALENAQRGVLDAEASIPTAEAAVVNAANAVKNAEAAYQNAQDGVKTAEDGVKTAREAVANAEAAVANAESSVKDAEAGVTNANKAVADARAGVASAQRGVESAQATAAQARAQQTASLAQIQASIDQINAQADLGKVKAPVAGIITTLNVKLGGIASSSQPAVVIAENGRVEIKVSVAEDVFTNIKAGDEAGVHIATVSDEELTGRVGTLPVAANVQTNLYDVPVELPSGFDNPPIGAFATVTFYTDRRDSTIFVPTEAILTGDNDEKYVFIVNSPETGNADDEYDEEPVFDDIPVFDEDGSVVEETSADRDVNKENADKDENDNTASAVKVTVETGLSNNTDTEITSGLSEGDLVVVKGQTYLSDGAAVRIVGNNSETDDESGEASSDGLSEDGEGSDNEGQPEEDDIPFRIGTPTDALLKGEEGQL